MGLNIGDNLSKAEQPLLQDLYSWSSAFPDAL